jgi:hypothetical protein
MTTKISVKELWQAQLMLLVALGLQFLVSNINERFSLLQVALIVSEIAMFVIIAIATNVSTQKSFALRHVSAIAFLALISFENILSLISVLHSLITGSEIATGLQLLVSAVAIFMTNIIVFALWYWEIDSPGLTLRRWTKHDRDFQFTQQDFPKDYPAWKPQFIDYLYISITNAINFAPADARPVTHPAKMLMGAQALVSVFTLAIVIARSVSILGG